MFCHDPLPRGGVVLQLGKWVSPHLLPPVTGQELYEDSRSEISAEPCASSVIRVQTQHLGQLVSWGLKTGDQSLDVTDIVDAASSYWLQTAVLPQGPGPNQQCVGAIGSVAVTLPK